VEFSILEIYNEEIRDLIEPGKDKKLEVRQVVALLVLLCEVTLLWHTL
jgi:hypothetical protein